MFKGCLENAIGKTATLNQSNGDPLRDYKIYGNSFQEYAPATGTLPAMPSPDRPSPIISLGETSRNLFNINNEDMFRQQFNVTQNNYNGIIEFVGIEGIASYVVPSQIIQLKPNTKYTITIDAEATQNAYCVFNLGDSLSIDRADYGYVTFQRKGRYTKSTTFTVNDTGNFKASFYVNGVNNPANTLKIYSIQLNEDSTALPYRPYRYIEIDNKNQIQNLTTIINLAGHEPLRKVGDFADYIDFKSKELGRSLWKFLVDSNTKFSNYGQAQNGKFYMYGIIPNIPMKVGSRLSGICNVLPTTQRGWQEWDKECVHFGQGNNSIYLILKQNFSTIEDLYNYLSNNGKVEPFFIYPLANILIESTDLPEIGTEEYTNLMEAYSGDGENFFMTLNDSNGVKLYDVNGIRLATNDQNHNFKINANLELQYYKK